VARSGSDVEQLRADLVARALRDAGVEVIYAPPSAGLDQLAEAALQEDADAIGLPPGSTDRPIDRLRDELEARGIEDLVVFSTDDDPAEVVAEIRAATGRGLGLDGHS
jgi:methylmalonyl-CoA mutase C-terminal domain/subunit